MYNNAYWLEWLEEATEEVPRCEDCPYPNGCIRECIIENYTHENVAKIRDEEQTQ